MKQKYSRRTMVKQSSVLIGTASLLGFAACTGNKDKVSTKAPEVEAPANIADKAATAPAGDPLIALDNPAAKGLKYVHNGSKVDPKLRVDKAGVAGAEQFCSNCNFYKKVEGKEYGSCQLIPVPNKHVAEKGWCVTWAKKG